MDTDPDNDLQGLRDELRSMIGHLTNVPRGQLSSAQKKTALEDLQRVDEKSIVELGDGDSLCPICLTPYNVILSEEELALAMDSPAHPIEELGIAKLAQSWQCGHLFCRKDITKWITSGNDSCPMCRRQFLQQQNSEQTEEELARAEVDAQAVISHLREVGQFMRMRGQLLHSLGPLEARIQYLTDIIEDNGDSDGPSLNSGMYS
jgi:uncharacterized Zn finger protein (UPF0148 family)